MAKRVRTSLPRMPQIVEQRRKRRAAFRDQYLRVLRELADLIRRTAARRRYGDD